jgi:mannose-6-phosphate isomerase-like protein (cupin superfamily)
VKISKQNAEHYNWGNLCDGWHFVKNQELSIIHESMPPNTSEERHFHNARQFFFVLSGAATIEMDGEVIELYAHEGVEIAPSVPHQMYNKSNKIIEFLVISQPSTRGDRIVVD